MLSHSVTLGFLAPAQARDPGPRLFRASNGVADFSLLSRIPDVQDPTT
jgi:hypothetical protein